MAARGGRRSGFGSTRRLPSGRWQARYTVDGRSFHAARTFGTRQDADAYLATVRADLIRGTWQAPQARTRPLTFAEYARPWLADRQLRPRTSDHYEHLLDEHLLPAFGAVPLTDITADMVRGWHARLAPGRPTLRAHAYALLRTILADAVRDDLIAVNPAHIRGAGQANRARQVRPATLDELDVLVAALPPRYRVLALLSAWTGLRFGEATELRRKDVDVRRGVLHVRRGVTRVGGQVIVGPPKTSAGVRDVAIPPHLVPAIEAHLAEFVAPGKESLIFPGANGGHLAPSTLSRVFYPARAAAGRPDLRWHDLRHTGAVLAAATGATLAELMARLGHSTPQAALIYMHAAEDRDRVISDRLSELAATRDTPDTPM